MIAQDARKSFLDYVSLLVQVQYAIRSKDEVTANGLRRRSEEIDDLTPDETEWLYGLSGDLDMLTGDEVFEVSEAAPGQVVRFLQFENERRSGEAMLGLLRQMPFIKQEHLAYFRARAYDHLGFTELAVVFMSHAAELANDNERYVCLLLEELTRLRRFEEVRSLALKSIERPEASEDLLVFSAGALLSSTRDLDDASADSLCQKAISVLTPILEAPQRASHLSVAEFIYAMVTLGTCYDRMREADAARKVFSAILSLNPRDANVLVLRANASLRVYRSQALSDYRQALALGTRHPAPYIIMANEALRESHFDECEQLCKTALSLGETSPEMSALASEMLAICYFYKGLPGNDVRMLYQEAIVSNPNNERLRRFAQLFFDALEAGKREIDVAPLPDSDFLELLWIRDTEPAQESLRQETLNIVYRLSADNFREELAVAI